MNPFYRKVRFRDKSISQLPILFFMFVLASCPIMGQQGPEKSIIQPKDYDMWHTMRFPLISGDGKWTSYLLDYEQPQDTLVVMDIDGKSKYEFTNARGGQFAPSITPKLFAFNDDANGVGVLNLDDGTTTWVKEAQYFKFSLDGKYLACYNFHSKNGYLKLFDIENNKSTTIEGIQNFEFNPNRKEVVLITKETDTTKVEILYLATMRRFSILRNENTKFQYPMWNTKGDALIFLEDGGNLKRRLYYFENDQTPILKELDHIDLRQLGNVELSDKTLSFSNDGERVFFYTQHKNYKPKGKDLDTVKVQVWKGNDKLVYPSAQLYAEFEIKEKMAVWWPKTGKLLQIGTTQRPKAILTGDQKFALTYNPLAYEPQFKETPQTDYYITNLETGESKLFLEKMETALGYLSMSPNANFISYFKDTNWWIYNIQSNEHTNCTASFTHPLFDKNAHSTTRIVPYGYMGWSTNNDFLIYDEFDIWRISPSLKAPERLTSGRGDKITYRKYYDLYTGFYPPGISIKVQGYNLSQDLILATQDSLFNYGFAKRRTNGKITPFVKSVGNRSGLRKAMFTDVYICMSEKFNEPPSLHKLIGSKSVLIASSNMQQSDFKIGKTELISFKNKEGDNLHGLLHYPDNYEEGKQFPMIVNIYEIISPKYQKYNNPSLLNEDGFNVRNFTAAGYFVLEPDILVMQGNPGLSATDCTVTAVNNVLSTGMVDKSAIGLIGHSFGGYETAFIITQTDLFAAAVVGAGIFDIVSFAHKVNQETGVVGFDDMEGGQWNMGKSFYDDKESYRKNSPIESAQNIQTPTLIWTGDKDFHVDWHQSLKMYLSLRRLGVDVELLIYENEIHVLTKKENQIDLSQRIENWFSKYLLKK